MQIEFKHKIVKTVFDSVKQNDLFTSVTDKICKDFNVRTFKVLKEYQKGTSAGKKCVIAVGNQKMFIKIGEKVARENQVYDNVYFKNNQIFLNKIEKYCISPDILVLPFFEGYNLDEFLFDKSNPINQKIKNIEIALDESLANFWSQNIKKGNNNLEWVEEYMMGRFAKLIEAVDMVKIGKKNISMREFVDYPILYLCGDKQYHLPSIKEMNANILGLLKKYKTKFTTCVTADFQPPNMIIRKDGFKHIDLSNSEIDCDMALDVGKFFNFINRFYSVSFTRDGLSLTDMPKPDFKVDKKTIYLKVNKKMSQLDRIVLQLEEKFAFKVANLFNDFHFIDRIKLYKFVINSITIRRHLAYPLLADLLFFNLIDSYAEINDKVTKI